MGASGELSATPGLTLLCDVEVLSKRFTWSLRVGSHDKNVNVDGLAADALNETKIASTQPTDGLQLISIPLEEEEEFIVSSALRRAWRAYQRAATHVCISRHGASDGDLLGKCLRFVDAIKEEDWFKAKGDGFDELP